MGATLLGAHMPTAGGLHKALINGKAIGCDAVQVFTSSPQQWHSKPVTDEMVAAFKQAQKETGLSEVVSHDSYLINLCAVSDEQRVKSIGGLKGEMERCGRYGIPYVVSHIGARMGQEEDLALQRAADGIKEVLADSPESVTLLMETTAGQGSALNSKFEELARMMDLLNGPTRLAICLDTCPCVCRRLRHKNQ